MKPRIAFERRHSDIAPDHVCVIFFDLIGLKGVNVNVGREAGDELLKTFASVLESSLRTGDTVNHLGGDEFIVVLEGCLHQKALQIAEHLICLFKQKWNNRFNVPSRFIGARYGVTSSEEDEFADIKCGQEELINALIAAANTRRKAQKSPADRERYTEAIRQHLAQSGQALTHPVTPTACHPSNLEGN